LAISCASAIPFVPPGITTSLKTTSILSALRVRDTACKMPGRARERFADTTKAELGLSNSRPQKPKAAKREGAFERFQLLMLLDTKSAGT
jgi:hypothetical protein